MYKTEKIDISCYLTIYRMRDSEIRNKFLVENVISTFVIEAVDIIQKSDLL